MGISLFLHVPHNPSKLSIHLSTPLSPSLFFDSTGVIRLVLWKNQSDQLKGHYIR